MEESWEVLQRKRPIVASQIWHVRVLLADRYVRPNYGELSRDVYPIASYLGSSRPFSYIWRTPLRVFLRRTKRTSQILRAKTGAQPAHHVFVRNPRNLRIINTPKTIAIHGLFQVANTAVTRLGTHQFPLLVNANDHKGRATKQ